MPQLEGNISKMQSTVDANNRVQYQLPIGESLLPMNALIGQTVQFTYANQINCVHCGRKTKKSFNQGYCYPCLSKLAQCDTCIIKPELCHYHQGTCREPEWGEQHCLQDHYVYLSNTGNVKVGITRHVSNTVSSRWIDQGATQAVPIYRTANRRISGLLETALKAHIGDKTNWRKMLQGPAELRDLQFERERLKSLANTELSAIHNEHGIQAFSEVESSQVEIHYPVEQYPQKISSINLDKTPCFSGVLQGIKGQYLLLDENRVINIRKYSGYQIALDI